MLSMFPVPIAIQRNIQLVLQRREGAVEMSAKEGIHRVVEQKC